MSDIPRKSAAAVKAERFDDVFDMVIVGAGAAGLACALFAAWQDNKVLLLEHRKEGGVLVLGAQ
jgi:flavin-dependent dehydrogenase